MLGHRRGGPLPGILAVACDSLLIEPGWLEVSHVRIASPKLHRRWRIVVLADLQTDHIGDYERDVLRRAVEAKPDIVLLAGDYLQAPPAQLAVLYDQLRELLRESQFDATARVFAVRGNVERDGWTEIFRGLNVTTVDATQSFTVDGLRLTCLGLNDSFDRRLTIPGDADRFHLVLGHSPNFALGQIDADLLVAGHTHGGQVRLPLIGPVITFSWIPALGGGAYGTLRRPPFAGLPRRRTGTERRPADALCADPSWWFSTWFPKASRMRTAVASP